MEACKAWILELGGAIRVAVSEKQLRHLVHQPVQHFVPGAPAYANQVVFFERNILPMVNLQRRFQPDAVEVGGIAAILAHQKSADSLPEYGALALATPPYVVEIDDDQACALPDDMAPWLELCHACFKLDGQAVPVLNLARVFPVG